MRTVTEKYRAVNEGNLNKGEFVRQMRLAYPQHITQFNGYNDTVQILKNRGLLFEEKTMKHDVSDESIRRALDVELTNLGADPVTCKDGEMIAKAKDKAIANLSKDPLHYYNLLSNESSKVDKNDKMKETKRGKLEKDTFNDMKKATLKERKENLVEGTRALVGFLSGDRLTTTYNHYDGYPSNLGAGLETHYNDDDKAKDVAMKGYITYLDPETGEIKSTHKEAPGKLVLPDDPEQRAREIAEEIDKFGADYGYVWDDNTNQWITIKNTGIRSMIDQITEKLDMVNVHSGETMEGDIEEIDTSLDPLEDKKEIIKQVIQLIKRSMPADNETIKSFISTHYNDIINLGDDEAILDEFQEFLSVNTDYVDEKKINEDVDSFSDVIQVVGVENVEDALKVIEKYENEFNDGPVSVDQAKELVADLRATDEDEYDKNITNLIVKAFNIKLKGISEKKGKDHDGDGDVDGDDYMHAKDKAIKKAMGKSVNEDLTVVGHTPEEEKKNAEELVAAAKKAGRDAKIKYDGDRIVSVDIGAPGLGTPAEVRAVQDRQFADYDKNKPKDTKPSFKPKKLKKLTVGGKTYEKGDFDPNDDGRIMSIEKYPNGYYIQGGIYTDYGDGDGPKEGYGYAIDLKGNEMDEEDLEGMHEGKKPNVNEAVKNIITKVLEERVLSEAATNDLAKIAEDYGDFEGLKPAIIALQNIVTEIESFYDKTRGKIQKIYNDLGEVKNEEGLKVGAFIAPSIENAFKRDLRPIIKQQFHGGLEMPKVKRISQADVDRGYIQQEAPKETVFTPVNEKKK